MRTTIEPDVLQTFVAIADSGSFTEAARRVHRTQSAVSMQIKRLEETLGRQVFARENRRVALTQDGEILLRHARRILNAHQEALAVFAQPDLHGTVTLGTADEYAVAFLPAILARFAEFQCHVQVDVVCDETPNLIAMLGENALDFALVTQGYAEEPGIELVREPLVWVTSAHHCAHEQDPLPLALFHPGCNFRQRAINALARQERAYRLAYTSRSLAAIFAAVHAGHAVTVTPRSNVRMGMQILGEHDGFPGLPDITVELHRAEGARAPIHDCLESHIVESFRERERIAAAA